MGAADASGLVVSYIQSLYWEFGSGCVLPATGVLMQNRGASFSLDPKALNALAPGRRPFHTLNPALAALKDGRVMAYGTMGGDGQPQIAGRACSRATSRSASRSSRRSTRRAGCSAAPGARRTPICAWRARFDGNLIDRLMSAGHDVAVLDEAYSDTMGHAGAVDPASRRHAGRRPRSARRRRRGGGVNPSPQVATQHCYSHVCAALRDKVRRMTALPHPPRTLPPSLLSPRRRARIRMSG